MCSLCAHVIQKSLFDKRKKDTYRRYRDMSIFVFIGVYAISIIDAYVDAELASFDLSKDLSMKVEPTVIQNNQYRYHNGRYHLFHIHTAPLF